MVLSLTSSSLQAPLRIYYMLLFSLIVIVIGSNVGSTGTHGEQGVSDCIAAGNLPWKCYTEYYGINPQW